MRRLLLGTLIFLTFASECSAHGAIAYGYDGSIMRFVAVTNVSTITGSQLQAMEKCRSAGLARCDLADDFENSCMAVAVTGDRLSNTTESADTRAARQMALSYCSDLHNTSCSVPVVACDGTAASSTDPPAPEADQQTTPEQPFWFGLGPAFFRDAFTELAISGMAQLVVLTCCLWIFVLIVSTTPTATLKRHTSISAWIGLPTALAFAASLIGPHFGYFLYHKETFIYLWTDVFVALLIGGGLRRNLSSVWQRPSPLSLPLATLAFTTVSAIAVKLFVQYGIILTSPDCSSPPYSPFTVCNYFEFEGLYFSAALFVVLIMCGAVLPAGSNLVLAYDHLKAQVRKSFRSFVAKRRERQAQREIERTKQMIAEPSAPYPVPAIYQTQTVDKMCLKLKRSQRSGLFGKPTFVLDARMEVTAEEAALVRKYGLGDDVIYESSSRQRRKEATLAQLEMTRDTPGYSESATKQLLGLGKTLYRLTRAGVSATAAALSLRVTVRSLMSGVHVECKSMGELLDAEKAIVEAAQNLRSYLDVAATFDGREEIIEF